MSYQDNEKNKRLRETIESLPLMTRDTAERARGFYANSAHVKVTHDEVLAITELANLLIRVQVESRERLAAWMVEHSFSTGHGDTFEDLLKELDWQVKELRGVRLAHAIVWELKPETSKSSGDEIRLERRDGFKGRRWAITKRGYVLNKNSEWEYEPIPSSRTEEWLETTRWETPELAIAALAQALQPEEKEGK